MSSRGTPLEQAEVRKEQKLSRARIDGPSIEWFKAPASKEWKSNLNSRENKLGCVGREHCSRAPETFQTFQTFRTFRTCRTMFRTKIAICGFSATRQTGMPIRIVPRFCPRGYRRFQKLLYGCRNPSRWDKTGVQHWHSTLAFSIGIQY